MDNTQNAIRVNMRGFLPNASKRFVLCENKTESDEFTVTLIHGEFVEHTVVYRGIMTKESDEFGESFWVGDFSAVTEDGDYYVTAGGFNSRQFVIYENVYDICQRTMLEYFTYQRCGHALGWNGRCHTDDGYIKETGEQVDLSGGYHQSCDLRKSPGGLSIGVLGMLRFALTDRSEWGEILVFDEVKWACDYFEKNIQQSGVMYNTMNDPFGWRGRIFYKSAAPSSAQWNTTSILALGSIYCKERDAGRSNKYLEAAKRSYAYMVGDERPDEKYRHPDKPQRGFDPDFFYDLCQKNSTADILYRISADCDMYKATREDSFLDDLRSLIPLVCDRFLSDKLAFVATESHLEGRTVGASCNYCWAPAYPMALIEAYEILGGDSRLEKLICNAADAWCDFAESGVWRNIRNIQSDADLETPADMPKPGVPNYTKREVNKDRLVHYATLGAENFYWIKTKSVSPLISLYGAFLAAASRIFSNERYARVAQQALDLLLGANCQDSSRIRGIGYNHVQHKAFGQFFPSTPFIPGAVSVGYSSIDVYSSFAEYDMPCVGNLMYLISQICRK